MRKKKEKGDAREIGSGVKGWRLPRGGGETVWYTTELWEEVARAYTQKPPYTRAATYTGNPGVHTGAVPRAERGGCVLDVRVALAQCSPSAIVDVGASPFRKSRDLLPVASRASRSRWC